MLTRLLAMCGGFLLAVLWFDLMFDVQVLRFSTAEPVPEPVLASIAAYYRRVTTEAFPMNRAIGAVMLTAVVGSVWQLYRARRRVVAAAALALCAAPVGLAASRVFPNAIQLGARADTLVRQSELARTICVDHALCVVAILAFTGIQLSGVLGERRHAR